MGAEDPAGAELEAWLDAAVPERVNVWLVGPGWFVGELIFYCDRWWRIVARGVPYPMPHSTFAEYVPVALEACP